VPYAGNVAVATTCLGVVPYLLEHAPVACMPRLDALIRSLVSVAPPAVVAKLSMRLLLSEFSIFKDQTATVLLSSLHWNSWEQWGVWELLSAEWQAKHHDKELDAQQPFDMTGINMDDIDGTWHDRKVAAVAQSFSAKCPPDVRQLALRCVAAEPEDRPNVLEVASALDPYDQRQSSVVDDI
ncbi:hypothetical protein DYB34_006800, partial [Aphanomyces astaci]